MSETSIGEARRNTPRPRVSRKVHVAGSSARSRTARSSLISAARGQARARPRGRPWPARCPLRALRAPRRAPRRPRRAARDAVAFTRIAAFGAAAAGPSNRSICSAAKNTPRVVADRADVVGDLIAAFAVSAPAARRARVDVANRSSIEAIVADRRPKYCVATSSSWCASSTMALRAARDDLAEVLWRTAASAQSRW